MQTQYYPLQYFIFRLLIFKRQFSFSSFRCGFFYLFKKVDDFHLLFIAIVVVFVIILCSLNCSSASTAPPSSLSLSSSLLVELLLSSFRGPYFMLTLCHHSSLFRWPISLLFSCSVDSTRSLHPRRSLTHSHRTQKRTFSAVTVAKPLNHCSPSFPFLLRLGPINLKL